ncbi:nuclear transport factor 2 family protein [Pseudoalteromonas mariniglutinosa]|uniref:nuclear transport factor 2 family protein n=1 Tax=Pseudoalteromonas mariniglutinosa TaxID=206042 RepID=UPI00384D1B4F
MMKTYYISTLLVVASMYMFQAMAQTQSHKKMVESAFEQWRLGTGTPFDLLAEDATWTILGPTKSAKTYNLADFRELVVVPFNKRLVTPLKPKVHNIYQAGDEVIILFEAEAKLVNGSVYRNSYAWFFTMQNGQIINVRAVLDLNAYDEVMAIDI